MFHRDQPLLSWLTECWSDIGECEVTVSHAISRVEESFDMDMTSVYVGRGGQTTAPTASITFTVEQLEAMLAGARRSETGTA